MFKQTFKDVDVKRFHRLHGFVESKVKPITMCLPLESARNAPNGR